MVGTGYQILRSKKPPEKGTDSIPIGVGYSLMKPSLVVYSFLLNERVHGFLL